MTVSPDSAPLRLRTALLAVLLVAACGSPVPTSQVKAAPSDGASEVPSAAPSGEALGSGQPSDAPPSDAPPSDAPPGTPSTVTPAPPAGPPDRPAKVTWKQVGSTATASGTRVTYRITWQAPAGTATGFKVYGVTRCLRESKKNDSKPCVVKGMKIPRTSLKLLATVPGDLRTADVSWKLGEVGPPPYWAVLIRASNQAGDSIFAIAHSEDVCWGCTY
jgi:hypothetical protein